MTDMEYKVLAFIWILLTGVVGYWIKDLKEKQTRAQHRVDEVNKNLASQRDKLVRLEAATITEPEVLKLMNDMERRVLSEFKSFRLEFKEDLREFRDVIKEDIGAVRERRRDTDRD